MRSGQIKATSERRAHTRSYPGRHKPYCVSAGARQQTPRPPDKWASSPSAFSAFRARRSVDYRTLGWLFLVGPVIEGSGLTEMIQDYPPRREHSASPASTLERTRCIVRAARGASQGSQPANGRICPYSEVIREGPLLQIATGSRVVSSRFAAFASAHISGNISSLGFG